MCERFAAPDSEAIQRTWRLGDWGGHSFAAHYNVRPGGDAAIFVGLDSEGRLKLVEARWGQPATARSEDAANSPQWRQSYRSRCLVPALGWYQSRGRDELDEDSEQLFERDQAYFARLRDAPFCLGGLISASGSPGSPPSFAILTRGAPPEAAEERIPVVVMPEDYAAWLDPAVSSPEKVNSLIEHAWNLDLLVEPVRTAVGQNEDGPELIRPIPLWPHPPTGTGEARRNAEVPRG
jgi:putative SOS response-associated peptidase YedK